MAIGNPATTTSKQDIENCYQEFTKDRYPWWKFAFEGSYLLFTLYLWIRLILTTTELHQGPLPTLIGFILAQFLVDYLSGVMHWAGDTWGTLRTPVFGTALIGPFRMHHVDPQNICIHNFMQTNASSSYPAPPFVALCIYTASATFFSQTMNWMIIFGVPLGILTNECHKWAHMVHIKPHKIIRYFQKAGLVISPEKHNLHHQGEFDQAYCIVNGWMNPILDATNHWRTIENIIVKITGATPREDDKYWREFNIEYNERQKAKQKAKTN